MFVVKTLHDKGQLIFTNDHNHSGCVSEVFNKQSRAQLHRIIVKDIGFAMLFRVQARQIILLFIQSKVAKKTLSFPFPPIYFYYFIKTALRVAEALQ